MRDANADTSGPVSRKTQLNELHTARNCLFSPTVVSHRTHFAWFSVLHEPLAQLPSDVLLESQLEQSLLNKLGLMDMETVRLILYDRSTDALPLAELEGLLEVHHVFSVNRIPVSGEIIHLDDSVSLRS